MRRFVLALVLTGCGGFLPFFGDDDDPAPPPPPVAVDASTDTTTSEGGAGADANVDAGPGPSGPDAGTWTCAITLGMTSYDSEDECIGARLGSLCDVVNPPPEGEPCTLDNGPEDYCLPCQKVLSSTMYSFSRSTCRCN